MCVCFVGCTREFHSRVCLRRRVVVVVVNRIRDYCNIITSRNRRRDSRLVVWCMFFLAPNQRPLCICAQHTLFGRVLSSRGYSFSLCVPDSFVLLLVLGLRTIAGEFFYVYLLDNVCEIVCKVEGGGRGVGGPRVWSCVGEEEGVVVSVASLVMTTRSSAQCFGSWYQCSHFDACSCHRSVYIVVGFIVVAVASHCRRCC